MTSNAEGVEEKGYDVALVAFRGLVCGIGTVGNLLVIFVILILREYKKAPTHWYILQLAIADAVFLLTIPFKITEDVHHEWIYSGTMCKMKEAILFLNYYSSILFLMVMSIDRYIAVCHALSPRLEKLRTNRAAYLITLVVWLTSLALCGPIIAYSDKMGYEPNCKCQYRFPMPSPPEDYSISGDGSGDTELKLCIAAADEIPFDSYYDDYSGFDNSSGDYALLTTETTKLSPQPEEEYNVGCSYAGAGLGWKWFILFNFVVMFAIPLAVMTACYAMIVLRLKRTRIRSESYTREEAALSSVSQSIRGIFRRRKRLSSAASVRAERNRTRVNFMCGALVVTFTVCWLPYHTIHLAKMRGIPGSAEMCFNISAVAAVLAYLNSALNPYLYNFVGTRFGKRLRTATGSIRKSVKRRTASSLSHSGAAPRYHASTHHSGVLSSTGTAVSKVYRRKSERTSGPESSGGSDDVFIDNGKRDFEQEPMVEFNTSPTPKSQEKFNTFTVL